MPAIKLDTARYALREILFAVYNLMPETICCLQELLSFESRFRQEAFLHSDGNLDLCRPMCVSLAGY